MAVWLRHAAGVTHAWLSDSQDHRFIHTICRPDELSGNPFKGDLGKWTPCFIDLALLGLGHVFAIICYMCWLVRITHSRRPDRFRLTGWLRGLHVSLVAAAAAAAAIPLFQLNARLAEQSLPDAGGGAGGGAIAPHEWLGLSLAAVSSLLLAVILVLELQDKLVLTARWMVRAPLVLVASSELVKLRFVVVQQSAAELPGAFGYFFWLYCAYVAAQVYLAVVLLFWHRDDSGLQLVKEGLHTTYMPLRVGAGVAAAEGVCPEWSAGLLSRLTFSWLSPLIRQGYKTPLQDRDIWSLPPDDRVGATDVRFREAWEQQQQKKGPKNASLFAACASAIGPLFLSALPFKLLNDASQFVGPVILNRLLTVVAGQANLAAAAATAAAAAAAGSSAAGSFNTTSAAAAAATAAVVNVDGGAAAAVGEGLPDSWVQWLEAPLSNGYCLAFLLFFGTTLGVLADNQHFQRVMRAGFRLKAIVTAEVYRKVLVLAPSERQHLTAGKLFNLVSSDANTLGDFCANAFGFLSAPLRIVITMIMLWRQLGASALVAITCIAAAVPINSRLVGASAAKLRVALKHGDTRAKLETELVSGIEVVKASTWEQPFHKRISGARSLELAVLRATLMLQSLMGLLVNTIPTIIPVISFLAYLLLLKQPLSAAQAFTALSLFNILRFPLFQLPQIVTQATQARVALGRLHDLLTAQELTPSVQSAPEGAAADADDGLAIRVQGDFTWDPDKPPTLTGLNLRIKQGQLVAVVGPTGAGKSSLLSAMLGLLQGVTQDEEYKGCHQQVSVIGSTAYVPQSPFILGGTVRDNIMFGRQYDEERYRRAVQAAQLEPDLAQLQAGDMTELGDRGTNISGGQKQRVAIARALYACADVVLMDDPLSALDSRVGRAVAQQAIKQVLADKTVVLATNQLQFVSMADVVVVMRAGAAVEVGSYAELLNAGGLFTALMKEAQAEEAKAATPSSDEGSTDAAADAKPFPSSAPEAAAAAAGAGGAPGAAIKGPAGPGGAPKSGTAEGGRLVQDEQSATGGVSWAVVKAYITALGGWPVVVLLFTVFILAELFRVGATVWLSIWTGQEPQEAGQPEQHSSLYYMGIYAAISGAQLVMLQINFTCVVTFGIRAGRVMHEALLSSLLRAPMSFYHTTPAGRIINRLTKDTADIDRNLAGNLSFAFRAFLQLVSTVIMIAVGAPFALPALLVMMGVFYALYKFFMASVRQAKRLEAVSRSPVLSSVNEAIAGLATIRAFNIGPWLIARNRDLVDKNAAMSLLNQSLNRWLSVRLEGLGAFCTLMAALVTVEQQSGNAATMGLLLSYALQITIATSLTLRVGSMAEQTFNAVERVDEYCHLPEEAAYETSKNPPKTSSGESGPAVKRSGGGSGSAGGSVGGAGPAAGGAAAARSKQRGKAGTAAGSLKEPLLPVTAPDSAAGAAGSSSSAGSRGAGGSVPSGQAGGVVVAVNAVPEGWPREGSIEFSDVKMRYRPGLPLVLCGLSFKVEPGFKVGVVGRTGAGKSSLIGALFRLTEIDSGCIAVDQVNTKCLGLRQLRSSMALIPQVPVLFTGSIRENLAPFGGHTDSALWSALRRAHLAPVVEDWEAEGLGGLDFVLGEGGSPLSAGQKQLLALARALLNPAKILVLDEATANVDVETDALIQETLRSEFSDRTLLAVAHRLHTIIEADRVLVMDKGKALEYGRPADLLENQQGAFTGMVRETGEATERFLRSMAAGDASAKKELEEAAAAALASVTSPCNAADPGSMAALAGNLLQGAHSLSRQLQGLVAALRSAAGSELAAVAASNVAAVAAAATSLGSGPSMNRLMSLAAANSLAGSASDSFVSTSSRGQVSMTGGNNPATIGISSDGSSSLTAAAGGGGAPAATQQQEAVQQIRAAMAALAQLNEAAAEAQQLLGLVPAHAAQGGADNELGPGVQEASFGQPGSKEAVPEGGRLEAANLRSVSFSQTGTPSAAAAAAGQQGAGFAQDAEGGEVLLGSARGGIGHLGGAGASGGGSPFLQAPGWQAGGSRSGRRSSGGLSVNFDNRPSSFTAGVGLLCSQASAGRASVGVGEAAGRRVSMDSGGGWRGGGLEGSAWSAGSSAAASRGRMSVDLSALCPMLSKCEQEQAAAMARQQQQQQGQAAAATARQQQQQQE